MPSTFKDALSNYLQSEHLVFVPDRDHLERWAGDNYDEDPIWGQIAAIGHKFNNADADTFYGRLIFAALMARKIAEQAGEGHDAYVEFRIEERAKLLDLVAKAQELANHTKQLEGQFDWAERFERHLISLPQLRHLYLTHAAILTLAAGEPPKPTTRISRQRGGRKKRARSREYVAFMHFMVEAMRTQLCGQPQYNAVATMTNIAFPDAYVTAEDARSAVLPTTRSGRRRNTAAHST